MIETITDLPQRKNFHDVLAHEETDLFILKNRNNLYAAITNFGARWVSMHIPAGEVSHNIVAGYDTLAGYLNSKEPYYGAVVGRYANRIAEGKFTLNDVVYKLPLNDGTNHLHGGKNGFHNVVWNVIAAADHSITLEYISLDGEENYPGTLHTTLTYNLTDDDEMEVIFRATSDADTHVNIVHHAFFNLNGFDQDILDHSLFINADHITPVNQYLIPTGEIMSVSGTPFDFRNSQKIGENMFEEHEQLLFGKGYDHNFILNKTEPFSLAATATGDRSNIKLDVFTSQPGLQLYSGNVMAGENILSGGYADKKYHAFCLETQHFPDSPNHPAFPSTLLKPGDQFQSRTIFKFSVDRG